jgi:talin
LELRNRTIEAGFSVSTQYRELLQIVLTVLERPGAAGDLKQNMSGTSRKIAQSVTELVAAAEMLKGKINFN